MEFPLFSENLNRRTHGAVCVRAVDCEKRNFNIDYENQYIKTGKIKTFRPEIL